MQVHGETHPAAKLTEDEVRYCRMMIRRGLANCEILAAIFYVTQGAMWSAVHGRTWNCVPGAVAYTGPWRGGGVPLKRIKRGKCPECGHRVWSGQKKAKYCSGTCRARAWYWRHRPKWRYVRMEWQWVNV